ncbi:MAG: PhzF family phenazine biosynthesis protein [Acidobacteriota bacterium]
MPSDYLHLDVFTSRPFEGNQLAVFPRPEGLTAAAMQAITQEMNFSECTFIFPPEATGDVRMRIFTPHEELPMAGHPTIGSTFALAAEGWIAPGRQDFVFELGVGPIPVSLEWRGDELFFVWMTQLLPIFGGTIGDRAALASAAGLRDDDLFPDLPAQSVSCGIPYLVVPLTTRAAVDRVVIDRGALGRCFRDAGLEELPVFLFTTDAAGPTREPIARAVFESVLADAAANQTETVYSRMLAPGFGVAEDPATGSASGPLGCYLHRHQVVSADQARSMLSLQGVAMGRPSRIHISIDSRGGAITRVRVGGQAVMVGKGVLNV